MKAILFSVVVALSTPVLAQERIAVELLIDDSGVLLEADAAQAHKLLLLSHVKALATKRSGANAKVEVISTSYGRTVWSGTPNSLAMSAAVLLNAWLTAPTAVAIWLAGQPAFSSRAW